LLPSQARRFPKTGGEVRNVDVSPDGRWVIFGVFKDLGIIGGLDAHVKALYIVRMNGNHLRKLVGFHLDVGGGDWAPNGKRIEFSDHSATALR
jgi:hypothetical protein